ncbi:hypothetical protein WJX84_001666 [Apatococcus fuscideae]|uniref:Uncharacterized protein n=1 Tax=Apatococcus fuscideae TaxID=2026836 RepID=A0AAW1SW27_9CHLO
MAADAHKRASKVMDAATEARLARIINSDLEQLREKAEVQGVLAYGLNPVRRERLNERFLQNTLKSVGYANKKADEDSMWAARKRQRGFPDEQTSRPAHRSDEYSASSSGDEGCHAQDHGQDASSADWLSRGAAVMNEAPPSKRRRGRGGRGLKQKTGQARGPA